MEKQKPWQLYLIIAVLALTLYNILPTIFYYSKPLKSPITQERSSQVAEEIATRVNSLESDSIAWLGSFNKAIGLKPAKIAVKDNDPRLIEVDFNTAKDAALFSRLLPSAGQTIPFLPSKLSVMPSSEEQKPTTVVVLRELGVKLNDHDLADFFHYVPKTENGGQISASYRNLVDDRTTELALAFAGPSKQALQIQAILDASTESEGEDLLLSLSKEISDFENAFGSSSELSKRYYASFLQGLKSDRGSALQKLQVRMDALLNQINKNRGAAAEEKKKAAEQGLSADTKQSLLLTSLDSQAKSLGNAIETLKKRKVDIQASTDPLKESEIQALLQKSAAPTDTTVQVLDLAGRNPFVKALVIDWSRDTIALQFYPDVEALRNLEGKTESDAYRSDRLNQLVINEIARVSRQTDETIAPNDASFAVQLNDLTNATSFLALDLNKVAMKQADLLLSEINANWLPVYPDFERANYPVRSYSDYKKEKGEEQKLGLILYNPSAETDGKLPGFRNGSIYVIAKGLNAIIQKARLAPDAPETKAFNQDLQQLVQTLQSRGFIAYSAEAYGLGPEFAKDYIFELDDYYSMLLKATRENFRVKGSKQFAVLDFSNVEQRILTENKIADRMQEDLLKWKEEYASAQVDLSQVNRLLVPPPTKNVYWENLKLSAHKYFAGDERKILKWGLDLSGGKTVRIGLRDHNNRPVQDPAELKQAVNELYARINKMGVSEQTIRIENENIILDFPGSQELTAADLVKASAMYFHIVNEKFTPRNPNLKDSVNQFLQDIWNEAVVTNRKDIDSINEIAWEHLGGHLSHSDIVRPRSEAAEILYANGLKLADPSNSDMSGNFDDSVSSIAMMRGTDFAEWQGQTHPLLVVFHNFALEGSSLTNVQTGFDTSEGNTLSFSVKSSYEGSQGKGSGSPRDDLYAWTSQFAEDRILGTPKELYSQGSGWRMAVILNGSVISQPSLRAALRDSGSISGRFSQREVSQLAADLKAGSLSFTPRILSEQNVSPELGTEERSKGIFASLTAIALVVIAMVGYYRFAGVVASVAVLLNIFIMWGVLQNLDAALTLPGIAGIVLTIGMAVDANVLVFERIREEFKISGRIASAIQAGYRKAFSAIVDSNITTIIAAVVLIQYDSGPIKGFAITLIIGIVSSMFTALFLTRYFFAGWVKNPLNKTLPMSQFFEQTNFDFLGNAKKAILISLATAAVGMFLFAAQFNTMFGMDFTGGYSIQLDVKEKPGDQNYRLQAADALQAAGATVNDFQIRELSRPNQLRIQLSTSMEEKGHPFYDLPQVVNEGKYRYAYASNPRISWVVKALADKNIEVQDSQLETLDNSWTVISGQFSDEMRNNALKGLALALLGILLYITFRFEFKYAVAAVIGLVHDIIITLGILALLHWFGLPVQIDLQVIGAIMTIIGYSLNDTIIVFDRIREDVRVLRKLSYGEVINHALNVTLSRTLMTSGTTLLVLLALVLFGGKSIFDFSLVMTIGVIVGTLSSLFIAAPALLYFHNKEVEAEENKAHSKSY